MATDPEIEAATSDGSERDGLLFLSHIYRVSEHVSGDQLSEIAAAMTAQGRASSGDPHTFTTREVQERIESLRREAVARWGDH